MHRRQRSPGAVLIVAAVVGLAAGGSPTPAATAQDAPPPRDPGHDANGDAPAAPVAEQARRGVLFARVGDVRLTVGDVEDRIARMPLAMRDRLRDPSQLADLAVGMARFELLGAEAARRGYGDDPDVVRSTQESLVQQLLRRDFDERFTFESVPIAEARRYFDEHQDEFGRPELRRAAHILVDTRDAAKALLAEVKGMDRRGFQTLARQRSLDDQTKARGGDLRFFAEDGTFPQARAPTVAEPLAAAAFAVDAVDALHPSPIPVGDRFSVLMLTGVRVAETRDFPELEGTIRLRIARDRRNAAVDALRKDLREKATVRVDAEALRGFKLDLPDPPAPGRPPVSTPTSPFAPRRDASGRGAPGAASDGRPPAPEAPSPSLPPDDDE